MSIAAALAAHPVVLHQGEDYFSFRPYHPDSPSNSPSSSCFSDEDQDAYSPSSLTSSPASSEASFISESFHLSSLARVGGLSLLPSIEHRETVEYVDEWRDLSPSAGSDVTLVDDEGCDDDDDSDFHRSTTPPFPVTPPAPVFTLTLPPVIPRRKSSSPSSSSPSSDRVEIVSSPSSSGSSSPAAAAAAVASSTLRTRERSVHADTPPWSDVKEQQEMDTAFAFGLSLEGHGLLRGARLLSG